MDLDYLSSRMEEERDRAAEADSPEARAAHEALADQYAAEIERLRGIEQTGGTSGFATA